MTTVEMELENSPSFISLAMTALRLTSSTVSQIIKSRKTITLEEVAFHDSSSSCWLVIYDRVYDVTDFLKIHPGGADVLLEYAGRDATLQFRGTGHTKEAIESLKDYEIGELPPNECIFRCENGIKLSDIPE